MTELKAYTVKQFCEAHNLPESTYYLIRKEGKGPRVTKAGRRTLISIEAAEEWRNRTNSKTKS